MKNRCLKSKKQKLCTRDAVMNLWTWPEHSFPRWGAFKFIILQFTVNTCEWLKGKIAHYLVEISRFKLWALRGSEREEAAWKTNTNAFQSSMKIHNFIHVELFLAFQQRLRHSNVGVSPGFVETLLSEKHSAKAFIHSKARRFSSSFPLTCAVMILL